MKNPGVFSYAKEQLKFGTWTLLLQFFNFRKICESLKGRAVYLPVCDCQVIFHLFRRYITNPISLQLTLSGIHLIP